MVGVCGDFRNVVSNDFSLIAINTKARYRQGTHILDFTEWYLFFSCCYALQGIELYVPQYMTQDELLKVIVCHVFAMVLAMVLYIQRKTWIRVFVGVALVPMMLMMWTTKSMWMDAEYLPKVINNEFQNMSQKERYKEYNPNYISEKTGLQFPQVQGIISMSAWELTM